MSRIVWDNDTDDRKKSNQIGEEQDFKRNKIKAEEIEIKHKKRGIKYFRIKASTHHLEMGITFPKDYGKTNQFATVGYNQESFEFDRKAKNAYDYFEGMWKRLKPANDLPNDIDHEHA